MLCVLIPHPDAVRCPRVALSSAFRPPVSCRRVILRDAVSFAIQHSDVVLHYSVALLLLPSGIGNLKVLCLCLERDAHNNFSSFSDYCCRYTGRLRAFIVSLQRVTYRLHDESEEQRNLPVQTIEVVDHGKDLIVANDLRIEQDPDITRQWVSLHMGHTLQIGQQPLHFVGHWVGAFDFRDFDPDPSIKDLTVLSSIHQRVISFLRNASTC